jgi:phage baseplate assembly protein W
MRELYVQSDTEDAFQNYYIDETNPVNIVKQKIRMILLTNKGDVLGEPLFGVGLENYVFELEDVKEQLISEINDQVEKYIGEDSTEYDIRVDIDYNQYSRTGIINVYINDKLELLYSSK